MQVTKSFKIEMAHRVSDAYTVDCRGLHGHSYVIDITLADKIDSENKDMVVDFKLVKDLVSGLFDQLDHSIMIHDKDEVLVKLGPILNNKCVVVPFNPTAENMAKWIYEKIRPMFENFILKSVRVHETVSAYATYSDYDYNVDVQKDRLFLKKDFSLFLENGKIDGSRVMDVTLVPEKYYNINYACKCNRDNQ